MEKLLGAGWFVKTEEEEAAEKQKNFLGKLEQMFAASNMGEWTQEKAWADLDDHVAKGTSQEDLDRLRPAVSLLLMAASGGEQGASGGGSGAGRSHREHGRH